MRLIRNMNVLNRISSDLKKVLIAPISLLVFAGLLIDVAHAQEVRQLSNRNNVFLALRDWILYGVVETHQSQQLLSQVSDDTPDLSLLDFPTFNSHRLDVQLQLYSAYIATYGVPDILIVGSSRSLQGIDPETLQTALAQQGRRATVYNFSVNGATAQVIDFILRELLTPEQIPKRIIWGDGSRAFNNLRVDHTFAQIINSPGYSQLQSGEHPIQTNLVSESINPDCTTVESSHSKPESESISDIGYSGYIHPINRLISLFPVLPNVNISECNGSIDNIPSVAGFSMDHRSSFDTESSSTTLEQSSQSELRQQNHREWVQQHGDGLTIQGFSPNPDVFNPTEYYQSYPKVPGAYDDNYVQFQLTGVQAEATIRLNNYLYNQDISLLFVNLPLTADYLDAFRREREQSFSQYLNQLAQRPGFFLLDLNQPEFSHNHFFADPSHINLNGARAIANQLANDSFLANELSE